MSIGYATVIPNQFDSPSDFLHRADLALYEAKAHGRDQVICFEPAAAGTI